MCITYILLCFFSPFYYHALLVTYLAGALLSHFVCAYVATYVLETA